MGRVARDLGEATSGSRCVGIQMVSCDSAHIVPDTGRARFLRTFVGEPGRGAESQFLARCLGST